MARTAAGGAYVNPVKPRDDLHLCLQDFGTHVWAVLLLLCIACIAHNTMSQQTASRAKRIGALLFCPACGTLLDLPRDDQDEIDCHQCGRKEPASCEWPPERGLEPTLGARRGASHNMATLPLPGPPTFIGS